VVPRDGNEPPCLYVNRMRAGHYQVPISIPDYTTGVAKLTEHGTLMILFRMLIVGFEVSTAVTMKNAVFLDVDPCRSC
jgi:hypothetical protein